MGSSRQDGRGGAAPARPAVSVERSAETNTPRAETGLANWLVRLENGEIVRLSDLTKNDLRSLCSRMGIRSDRNSTKEGMQDAVLADLRVYGDWPRVGRVRLPSRSYEPSSKPAAQKGETVKSPYPITRWCSDGEQEHAPVVINSAEEAAVYGGRCPACGAPLTASEPVRIENDPEPLVTEVVREVTDPALSDRIDRIERALEKLASGQSAGTGSTVVYPEVRHARFDDVEFWAITGRSNVFLSGEKGTGKSTLARQVGEAHGIPVEVEQCTQGMFWQEIVGVKQSPAPYEPTPLHKALAADGWYVLDEADNGDGSVLAGLNGLLERQPITFADGTVLTPGPRFRVICTANTMGTGPTAEYSGRVELDAPFLDRFAVVYVGIDDEVEAALVNRLLPVEQANHVLTVVRTVRERILRDAVDLRLSPSPRAAVRVAEALAGGRSIRFGLQASLLAAVEPAAFDRLVEGLDIDSEVA